MADLEISALSLEYVKVPVNAIVDGAPYDPTTATVKLAFKPLGVAPQAGDWQTGSWETASGGTSSARYWARCLVGPGGTITLPVGQYVVWVQVNAVAAGEEPVLEAGTLLVR